MLRQFVLRKLIKRMMNFDKPLNEVRMDIKNIKVKETKKETTTIEEVVIKGINCHKVIPEGCDTQKMLLFIHGGGYCLGAYGNTIQRSIDLAEYLNVSVLMIDYPLAPENPFPIGIQSVNKVYDAVSKDMKVALIGESSGCGLALNLMVCLRELEEDQPACAIMITPFLDATYSSKSNRLMKKKDPFFVEKPYVISDYYTNGLDKKNPMVSPIFHDVHDLAPTLIHVAEYDTLSDDGTELYCKILAVGGNANYKKWKRMWHLFHTQSSIIPEGKKAMKECKDFLDKHFI